jgi:predicted Rdx family selenoprotein
LGVEAELVQGDEGIFDVIVDEHLFFSRSEAGRFPESDEIIRKIKS